MAKDRTLKTLGHILVLVLFLYLIINTNFKDIFKEIKKADGEIFVFVIFLQLITQYLLILQWHRITLKVLGTSTFSKIAYIFTKGTVIEAITPGAKIGGEATRLYYLKKEFICNTNNAINIILIQKSISMSVLMIICVTCLLYISAHMKKFLSLPLQAFISVIFLGFVLAMIGLLFYSDKFSNCLSISKNSVLKKIHKFISSYSHSVSKLGKKEWFIQFFISFLVWVLFPIKMIILAHSFDVKLNFNITIAITMTSYMMGMLPITPGGLGTFEGTMLTLLSVFSVKKSVRVAITVIFRFITFWFVIMGSFVFSGIYEFVKRGEKNV